MVLVLFGAKKLPDLTRSLGQSMNEFKKAREDIDRELHNAGAPPSQPRCLKNSRVRPPPDSRLWIPVYGASRSSIVFHAVFRSIRSKEGRILAREKNVRQDRL
jgi:TatA/E family protein of Tat protein translocase